MVMSTMNSDAMRLTVKKKMPMMMQGVNKKGKVVKPKKNKKVEVVAKFKP